MVTPTLRLAEILRERDPDVVLTHPYEGGHPDHDAAAFIAFWACRLAGDVPLWEMAGYHAAAAHPEGINVVPGRIRDIVAGVFLDASDRAVPSVAIRLSPAVHTLKCRMIECFVSQRRQIRELGWETSTEKFRPAPAYDFSRPPHPGALLYEMHLWARMTGTRWRSIAAQASATLSRR
jgi:LmbE family N-acetylglucosaminyl deacetylase